MHRKSEVVGLFLAFQMAMPAVFSQTPGFLKLTVVEGEGAFNDMKHKLGHPPSVRIVDEGNKPAVGAELTCTLPAVGPGAFFVDGGGRVAKATADNQGIARCPTYRPNAEEGRFNVKVAASYEGKTGQLAISQSNTMAGGTAVGEQKKGNKAIWIVALVAGGAAGGVFAATHKSSPSSAATIPPTVLSASGITVGGPR